MRMDRSLLAAIGIPFAGVYNRNERVASSSSSIYTTTMATIFNRLNNQRKKIFWSIQRRALVLMLRLVRVTIPVADQT